MQINLMSIRNLKGKFLIILITLLPVSHVHDRMYIKKVLLVLWEAKQNKGKSIQIYCSLQITNYSLSIRFTLHYVLTSIPEKNKDRK